MKKAGIIGGLGPETSAKFCLEVGLTFAKLTGKRPNIIVSNIGLPLHVETEVIVNGRKKELLLPLLIESAQQLEKAGVDFIVIPCNTVHVFIDEIRKSVKIPVLSIIEESSNFLKSRGVKRVGLLGTKITIKEGLFEKKLNEAGIRIITPNNSSQLKLGLLINRLVKNSHNIEDKKELLEIVNVLATKNVDCILLACTDLQLIIKGHKKVKIFDTLDILARATVGEIISK